MFVKDSVNILLVGISGYGGEYLRELLAYKDKTIRLTGVVDIAPQKSDYYDTIIDRGIPIYNSLEEYYDNEQAELAIISTPIHFHRDHSCYCMNHGSHVLCEKPMTSDPQDIQQMINVRNKTGKFLAIGFNWSFAPSTLELKEDINKGAFGRPIRLKSMMQWSRNKAYYNRSVWAGKMYDAEGSMIFDSVANNATAHFLHHLLYLLGDRIDTSAQLDTVTAELYRVNHIETFDTCAVQLKTKDDVDIYFYATHAVREDMGPFFQLEFEKATITYNVNENSKEVVAVWKDGTQKTYENPEEYHLSKLSTCINAVLTEDNWVPCGPEAASAQVKSIQAMHKSVPNIMSFPESLIHYDIKEEKYWIQGLSEDLLHCYNNWCLPNELDIQWSAIGGKIRLED